MAVSIELGELFAHVLVMRSDPCYSGCVLGPLIFGNSSTSP